eukprot:SAG11_NODE_37424_length_257_cov_0.620253_1_plen_45_part_01
MMPLDLDLKISLRSDSRNKLRVQLYPDRSLATVILIDLDLTVNIN